MPTGRSRKEIRQTLLVMLQAGTIKLKEVDYERKGYPSHEYKEFVRGVCFNFDILDELENIVCEYYQTRRYPEGHCELATDILSSYFDTESEIYNFESSDFVDIHKKPESQG